jgi:MFS family permease
VLLTNVGATFGTGFGMTSALLLLPQFITVAPGAAGSPHRAGYGFAADTTEVGLIMLAWAVSGVAGAVIAARLTHRHDGRWPLVLGGALMAVGLGGIASIHDAPWEMVGWLLITGCGFSQAAMGAVTVVIESVPPSDTGAATGMSTVIRQIGGTAGAQLMAAILAATVISGTVIPTEGAFRLTFGLCAAGAALGTVCGVFVGRPQAGRGSAGSARHVADAVALGEPPSPIIAADQLI